MMIYRSRRWPIWLFTSSRVVARSVTWPMRDHVVNAECIHSNRNQARNIIGCQIENLMWTRSWPKMLNFRPCHHLPWIVSQGGLAQRIISPLAQEGFEIGEDGRGIVRERLKAKDWNNGGILGWTTRWKRKMTMWYKGLEFCLLDSLLCFLLAYPSPMMILVLIYSSHFL